jgi:hypothetical protein
MSYQASGPISVNLRPETIQLLQRTLPLTAGMNRNIPFCCMLVNNNTTWIELTLGQLIQALQGPKK